MIPLFPNPCLSRTLTSLLICVNNGNFTTSLRSEEVKQKTGTTVEQQQKSKRYVNRKSVKICSASCSHKVVTVTPLPKSC